MALWHDPLDELIADLERTLPPKLTAVEQGQFPPDSLAACQLLVSAILWGAPGERERVERDPRVKAYLARASKPGASGHELSPAFHPPGDMACCGP